MFMLIGCYYSYMQILKSILVSLLSSSGKTGLTKQSEQTQICPDFPSRQPGRDYNDDCRSIPAAHVLFDQRRARSSMKNIFSSSPTKAWICSPDKLRNESGKLTCCNLHSLSSGQGSIVAFCLSYMISVFAIGLQVYAERTNVQALGPGLSHPKKAL